jgi:hypothetical protein
MTNYIDVQRIEYMITYECNSRCKHCMLGDEKRGRKPRSISSDLATRIIREITREYSPTSVMTLGGEQWLFPEVVCAIHRAAKVQGIPRREIINNAGYPRSETEFRVGCQPVERSRSGVTRAMTFRRTYFTRNTSRFRLRLERNVQSLSMPGYPCSGIRHGSVP